MRGIALIGLKGFLIYWGTAPEPLRTKPTAQEQTHLPFFFEDPAAQPRGTRFFSYLYSTDTTLYESKQVLLTAAAG